MHNFTTIGEFILEFKSENTRFGSKLAIFGPVTLKFDGWHWKTTGHLVYATSSFRHHFIAISIFLTGVTVRKCPNWDKICFDHCDLELGPLALTFSRTSLFSMVITPANFMMIRWEQHSENGVAERQGSWTDGQTDGRTERSVLRAAWSQLKYQTVLIYSC